MGLFSKRPESKPGGSLPKGVFNWKDLGLVTAILDPNEGKDLWQMAGRSDGTFYAFGYERAVVLVRAVPERYLSLRVPYSGIRELGVRSRGRDASAVCRFDFEAVHSWAGTIDGTDAIKDADVGALVMPSFEREIQWGAGWNKGLTELARRVADTGGRILDPDGLLRRR